MQYTTRIVSPHTYSDMYRLKDGTKIRYDYTTNKVQMLDTEENTLKYLKENPIKSGADLSLGWLLIGEVDMIPAKFELMVNSYDTIELEYKLHSLDAGYVIYEKII